MFCYWFSLQMSGDRVWIWVCHNFSCFSCYSKKIKILNKLLYSISRYVSCVLKRLNCAVVKQFNLLLNSTTPLNSLISVSKWHDFSSAWKLTATHHNSLWVTRQYTYHAIHATVHLIPNFLGSFINYVGQILPNFDPLPSSSGQMQRFYTLPTRCSCNKAWNF